MIVNSMQRMIYSFESECMMSHVERKSPIESSSEASADYCSCDNEMNFDLGPSNEDREDNNDGINNDTDEDNFDALHYLKGIKVVIVSLDLEHGGPE
jgi:hypothetical protein